MNRIEAIAIACSHLESKGFKLEGASNISEAVYLEAPGYTGTFRLAAHSCRHGFNVAVSLEFTDDSARFPPTFAYRVDNSDAAEIVAWVDELLPDYFAAAEKDEEDNDE